MNQRTKNGFTLVEVLVSVAVIVALVSVIMISPMGARKQAGLNRAKADIDQIATGALLYYQNTGTWAPDTTSAGQNATFYTSQYSPVNASDPSSYLGSNYNWDWQNWDFPTRVGYQCWQSEDLYRGVSPSFTLVMRKCLRDQCVNQKYCEPVAPGARCFNTAVDRDSGQNSIGTYASNNFSAVCEECTDEKSCAKKFVK